MTLLERLRLLPDDAMVPVAWVRELLDRDGAPEDVGDMLLSVSDVARKLHRAKSTVRDWCKAGRFEGAVRLGRDWGIPPAAVVTFIAALRGRVALSPTIGTAAISPLKPRRARHGETADLGAWRKERAGDAG